MMKTIMPLLILMLALPQALLANAVGMIPTPSDCTSIERVEEGKVYLKQAPECATDGEGSLPLSLTKDFEQLELYLDGRLWRKVPLSQFNAGTARAVTLRAEQAASSMKVTLPAADSEVAKKAKELAEGTAKEVYSPEYQARLARETDRARGLLFPEVDSYYKDGQVAQLAKTGPASQGAAQILGSDQRIYLFISSSMPLEMVRAYLADVETLPGRTVSVVMRGLVPPVEDLVGSIRFMTAAEQKDPSCDAAKDRCELVNVAVGIDPELFTRYGIDRVPALVYAEGVGEFQGSGSEGDPELLPVADYWVVYGDSSIEASLRHIASAAPDSRAAGLVKKIAALPGRRSWYNK